MGRLIVTVAFSCIRFRCQSLHQINEWFRLTDEEPHSRQELHHTHGDPFCLSRPNDRTYGQIPTQKGTGLRHDQVGLEGFTAKRRRIEVRKDQSIRGVSQRRCVTRLVRPSLNVHGFSGANANEYSQDLCATGPLCHGRVEGVTTLLDSRHVEPGCVGNGLDVLIRF